MNDVKIELLDKGIRLAEKFCEMNDLEMPAISIVTNRKDRRYGGLGKPCAKYDDRHRAIIVIPRKCAHPGNGIRSWSYPGHIIDRTPYGVINHELGHYVDNLSGWNLLKEWLSLEDEPLTGYGTRGVRVYKGQTLTDRRHEDFAEVFRLFVTNPQLLHAVRKKSYDMLRIEYVPVEHRHWAVILEKAPGRILEVARKRVLDARKEK